MRHAALLALVAVVVSTALPAPSAAAADEPQSYIVVFRDGVASAPKTDEIERRLGFASDFRYGAAVRGFAARLNAQQLARLRADRDVLFVAADRTVKAIDSVPIQPGDSAPTGVRRVAAATTTTAHRASTANVAVIDTGIDLSHSDLNAVNGKNCIGSGQARDDQGHGTHVAGSIGARNNGSGIIGVAPGTKLYAVKVLNSQGFGTDAQVVCGIDWVTAIAAALGIKVANMSLGGDGVDDGNCGNTNNDVVHRAICASVAAGVTYVVGAGNSGQNFAANYPASYDEVLTVTAMADFDGQPGSLAGANCFDGFFDADDSAASFSNFTTIGSADAGHTIAGPGVCITSTKRGGGTESMSGTSMATPHVAGVVALCFGEAGGTGPCTGKTPAQVMALLRARAASTVASYGFLGDPNDPVENLYFGHLAVVDAPIDTAPPVISAVQVESITSNEATVTWTTDEPADSRVDYGTTTAYGSTAADASFVTSHAVALTGLAASTTYHYRVKSKDAAGNEASATDRTFVTPAPSSDLALSGSAPSSGVEPGATFRYTLSSSNAGPSSATSVTLTDSLPANVTFVAASASQGSCTPSGSSVSCALGTLVPNHVLVDRPVAYWRLGESAGASVATDASGNGISGTYNGATLDAAGAVPGDFAAGFSGGAHVAIPAAAALDLHNALTVEAWVKPSAANQRGGIFEKTVGGVVNTQFLLFVEDGLIKFRGKPAASGYVSAVGPELAVGVWSQVVGTYDGATLRVYVNGQLAGSAAATGLAGGSGASRIGLLGAEGASSGIYPFAGTIDEVAVYASALSAGRVLVHYTNAATRVTTARVTIDVQATSGGTATNVASVTAAEPDPNDANNSVTLSTTVTAAAVDLRLSAAAIAPSFDLGTNVRYTLTASNAGPSTATGVTLADTLPSNATFVSASASQGPCTPSGGSVSCALGTLAANRVLADGPAAYWRLGEPAGASVVADASGHGITGTYQSAVLETAGAVPGDPAASFASGAHVLVPANSALDLGTALSVEAWVKPSVFGQRGGILEKTIGGAVNTQYLLFLEDGWVAFRGRQAGSSYVTVSGPRLEVGVWSHVVGTYDGTTLRLYVNGAPTQSAAAASFATGTGPLLVGHLGSGIYPFAGVIDEVAVYPTALSAAQVQAHYADAATRVTTARIVIEVRPTSGGSLTNSASVSPAQTESNPANNSVTQTTNVVAPAADLRLSAAPVPSSVDLGTTLRYTLSTTSGGPSPATNVSLTDTLPTNATFVAASASQGSCTPSGGNVGCALGTLVPNHVLVDRPVAYWRLGESAGASVATDAGGNGIAGAYTGVTLDAAGAVPADGAGSFAGGAHVAIPAAAALDLRDALTVEAWVKPSAANQRGGIFEKTVGGAVNTQFLMFLEDGWLAFRGRQAGGGLATAGGTQLPVGVWSHVVGTYDGTTLRVYVNGQLAGSAAASTLAGGSGASRIGLLGAEGGSSGIYPFAGTIDEVALYASALSAGRVLAHYADAATRVTTARVIIDVRPSSGGTLTNSAQVSSAETDPNTADNSVTQTTTVVAAVADLSLTGVALPDPATVGGSLRYTLSATNGGPSAATGVTLADTLPSNATFVSASASQGSCTPSGSSVSCALGTLATNRVLADRPAAYWRLGEPAGATIAADASGHGISGTYQSAVLETAGAVPGDAAASFASGARVVIPATTALDIGTALTVEAWVQPTVFGQRGGILEKTIGGAVNTQYLLFLEDGWIVFRVRQAGSGFVAVGGARLPVGTWSHVVGTYDGATLSLYVNGALTQSLAATSLATGAGPVLIGHLGSGIYPFAGVIDEVAIYPQAISAAQVQAHFADAATRVTTARVVIEVRPTSGGTATATAQVTGAQSDPNAADNSLTFNTPVN